MVCYNGWLIKLRFTSLTLRKQASFHFHPRPLGQVWGWRAPCFDVGWKLCCEPSTWAVIPRWVWAEERPHDQGWMVQPLYSSAKQVAQTCAAGYLESTRLAGQGEELALFFLRVLLRPNFCIHRHMSSEQKSAVVFGSKGGYCCTTLG